MVQNAKNNVAELNTDVAAQMAILREDITNLTATVAEYGKAQGNVLQSAAAQKAADLIGTGSAAVETVKAKADKTYTETEDAVRANPTAAVGIAAGLGFLVGFLASRR